MSALLEDPRETTRRNIPWVYLSTTAFFVAGAIFYLYLARLLSAGQVGSVVVLLAIATLLSAVFSLGLGPSFQHFLSFYLGRKDGGTVRALIGSGLLAAVGLGLAAAAATYGLAPFLGQLFFHTSDFTSMVQLVAIYAGLFTASTLLQSVLLGLQRFFLYSALSLATYGTTYGSPLVLLHFISGVRAVVLGWSVGAALGFALFLTAVVYHWRLPVHSQDPSPSPSPWDRGLYRSLLLYAIPLFASTVIATGASYVDRLILATLADLASVGVYNYAILVGSGSLIVVAPFATILIPKISEAFGRGEPQAIRAMIRTSNTLIVLVYVPFALAIASVGPFLLRFLVGPQFVAASEAMALLLVLTAIAVPYSVLTSLAAGVRRPWSLVGASTAAIGANAGLSFLLVPRLGMVGAAVGNSAMSWGVLIVLLVALRRTGLLAFDTTSIGRIWAAGLLMAAVIGLPLYEFGYSGFLAVPLVVVGLAVLLVGLRLSRAVPMEVRGFLERMLPRWLEFVKPAIRWAAPCEAVFAGAEAEPPTRVPPGGTVASWGSEGGPPRAPDRLEPRTISGESQDRPSGAARGHGTLPHPGDLLKKP